MVLRRVGEVAKETVLSHQDWLAGAAGVDGGEGQRRRLKVEGSNFRTNERGRGILLQKEC